MKYILIITSLLMTVFCSGQDIQSMSNDLANSSKMKNGRFSFYAINTATGKVIVEKNKDQRMIPASTMKLVTAYAALDMLGESYRFQTSLNYSGSIDSNGILHGDVMIKGGGDPVFLSEYFSKHYSSEVSFKSWIAKLAALGINSIDGGIIADASVYDSQAIPSDWAWEDIGNYYGAGSYGLSYGENKYEIYLDSKSVSGSTVSINTKTKLRDGMKYVCDAKAASISSDQVFVYSPPYSDYAILRGEMPRSKTAFKVKAAMTDPALFIAQDFSESLSLAGISISGVPTSKRLLEMVGGQGSAEYEQIDVIDSPKLIDIVKYMNLKSVNMIAESLVKEISHIKGDGTGSTGDGVEVIIKWLNTKGIGSQGLRMNDGSGLSFTNLLSSFWYVKMLKSMSGESWFDELKDALPTAGVSGSMRRIGKGTSIQGIMKAKTGYLNGARSYCGFLEKSNGELIVFSILANDYDYTASEMRKQMAKLMVGLGR